MLAPSDRAPGLSLGERVRLGEGVARALEAKREVDARAVLEELAPLAVEIRVEEEPIEGIVVKAAFLVDGANLAAFDETIERVARERASRMTFKYVGPLPPHDFVDLGDVRETGAVR